MIASFYVLESFVWDFVCYFLLSFSSFIPTGPPPQHPMTRILVSIIELKCATTGKSVVGSVFKTRTLMGANCWNRKCAVAQDTFTDLFFFQSSSPSFRQQQQQLFSRLSHRLIFFLKLLKQKKNGAIKKRENFCVFVFRVWGGIFCAIKFEIVLSKGAKNKQVSHYTWLHRLNRWGLAVLARLYSYFYSRNELVELLLPLLLCGGREDATGGVTRGGGNSSNRWSDEISFTDRLLPPMQRTQRTQPTIRSNSIIPEFVAAAAAAAATSAATAYRYKITHFYL